MYHTSLSEAVADLNVVTLVWFAAVLTVLRLSFIKMPGQGVRVLVEAIEVALIFGAIAFLLIQPFLAKAFYIPSGSMLPTLVNNDRIIVNRLLYRFEKPHHGDVVVFNAPPQALEVTGENAADGENIDYIKRLIGLPGDTIQVVAGSITVNGAAYHHDDIRVFFGLSGFDQISRDLQHLKITDNGVRVFDGRRWISYSTEDVSLRIAQSKTAKVAFSPGYVLRNGIKLNEPYVAEDPDYDLKTAANGDVVLNDPYGGQHINGPVAVSEGEQTTKLENAPAAAIPPGRLIVMGDNRNDSNDSSRWGTLSEDRLVGKAACIFFPFNRTREVR